MRRENMYFLQKKNFLQYFNTYNSDILFGSSTKYKHKQMHILNKKVLFSEMLSIWCRWRDVVVFVAVIDIVDVVVYVIESTVIGELSSHFSFFF